MRQYSSYKCTGVSWLTEIPAEWKTARLKTCVDPITERAENNNGYIGLENIESWTGRYTSKKKNEAFEAEGTSISIHKGNVLFGKLRPYLAKCYVAEAEGCCSTEFIVMNPKGIDSSFLKYLILSPSFIDNVNMSTYGSKMPRANWNYIGNMVIPIPNAEDQHGIVSYLNLKIGKIDTIIDETKATIEEFKQWKASIIYESVTKGLDRNAEMVDSGIAWIGKVPKYWHVCKTLYALAMPITDGPHTTPELFDEGIPFVSAEAVSCGNGKIAFDHIRGYISEEFYEECCMKYIPQLEDIYMIKSGATTGKVSYVDTDTKFTIWSPLAVFRVNKEKMYFKYLFYFLQSDAYQKQVQLGWSYGTQQNIGMRTLETLKICMPSLAEQHAIADALDEKCGIIDSLVSEKEALISDLETYKKALIFEVVTGKRKVV